MKIRNKVLFANAGVIFLFGMILISFFPITQNLYVSGQMREIEEHLKESVENDANVFEMIKFGSDAGHLVLTPQKVRGFEIFKPGTSAHIIGYEKISDIQYRIETSDGRDMMIQVNDQTLDKFMQLIVRLLVVSFLLLIIIDVIAVYFIMKSIVQPVQKIEEKIKQLVHFDFGEKLDTTGNDEFAVLSTQLNSLDSTLSQFIESRQAFATSLAHELKTPVAVVQSTIDLYEHQVGEYADYQYSKQLVEQSLARISETAKLSLQIFTRKSLFELKEKNITELVQQCLEQWEPLATKQQLNIETKFERCVWEVDEDSFMLILSTIFQNISRYAKRETDVSIEVGSVVRFKNVVADATSSGTQLGLEIAKTLAEQSNLQFSNRYEGDQYIVEIKQKEVTK